VTIILTTHYIEEAEEMADRVGVIHKGALIVVEEKEALMRKFGKKRLTLHLKRPMAQIPASLAGWGLELTGNGQDLVCTFEGSSRVDIATLLERINELSIEIRDLQTQQSSLEDIFVSLVSERA